MLYKLIYSSTQNSDYTPEIIENLIKESFNDSKEHNITGVLLYIEGKFIHLLEGEKDVILDLFENKICNDPRHINIRLLMKGNALYRNFPDWHVGFKNISCKEYLNYLKYNNYLENITPDVLFSKKDPLSLLFDIINYNSYNTV